MFLTGNSEISIGNIKELRPKVLSGRTLKVKLEGAETKGELKEVQENSILLEVKTKEKHPAKKKKIEKIELKTIQIEDIKEAKVEIAFK